MINRLGFTAVVLHGMAGMIAAQQIADPLSVSIASDDSVSHQTPIQLELANRSSKSIAAYVLMIDYYDAGGKKAWSQARLAASSGVVPTLKGRPFEAGKVWQESVMSHPVSGADRYTVKVAVDYVLFTDGSRWGPDVARKSRQLDGMREAVRMMDTTKSK